MKLKLLERLRRSRDKHKLEYLEQTSEREETEHIHDKFEDEIVEGRSPSMSRLQTLVDVKETSRPKDQAGLRTDPRTASEATTPNGPVTSRFSWILDSSTTMCGLVCGVSDSIGSKRKTTTTAGYRETDISETYGTSNSFDYAPGNFRFRHGRGS